jgi:ribonuclease HI
VIITAHTDGASRGNPGESGFGFTLRAEDGTLLCAESGYIGKATNNIAEYSALIACLRKVRTMECTKLVVYSDSELMVRQLNGQYKVKNPNITGYFRQAADLIRSAPFSVEIVHVERAGNREADELANAGIDNRIPAPAV